MRKTKSKLTHYIKTWLEKWLENKFYYIGCCFKLLLFFIDNSLFYFYSTVILLFYSFSYLHNKIWTQFCTHSCICLCKIYWIVSFFANKSFQKWNDYATYNFTFHILFMVKTQYWYVWEIKINKNSLFKESWEYWTISNDIENFNNGPG